MAIGGTVVLSTLFSGRMRLSGDSKLWLLRWLIRYREME